MRPREETFSPQMLIILSLVRLEMKSLAKRG